MTDWDILSSYLGLVSLATLTVYTGAFSSLPFPRKDDTTPSADPRGDDQYQEEESLERLSVSEAWLFPIVSRLTQATSRAALIVSCMLTGWICNAPWPIPRRQISWHRLDQLVLALVLLVRRFDQHTMVFRAIGKICAWCQSLDAV
jgi:hypothetical protein